MNKNDQDVGTGLVGAPGKQILLIPPLARCPRGVLETISVRIRRKPCSYQIENPNTDSLSNNSLWRCHEVANQGRR